MAYRGQRELITYLSLEDKKGQFLPINEKLKEIYKSDDREVFFLLQYLSPITSRLIDLIPSFDEHNSEYHISNLNKSVNGKIYTLDNLPIKARITPEGLEYYQKNYLPLDLISAQKELTESTLKTNKWTRWANFFIGATFVAISVSIYVQWKAIKSNEEIATRARQQIQEINRQENSKLPPTYNISFRDSLQIFERGNKVK